MTRARRRLVGAVALVSLLLLLSLVPFLWPRTDHPQRADAVFILSGDHGERLPRALRLMDARVAPTLVFVGTMDRTLEEDLCRHGGTPYEVLCVRPNPDSTRQEARTAAQLAHTRGWQTIVVVTSTQHITRSALLFRRCFDGDVQMVAGHPDFSGAEMMVQITHEWLGVAHALTLGRGC